MPQTDTTCPHCWHTTVVYSHKLNAGLVNALRKLVDYYETFKMRANLRVDLNLTHIQYATFQKLQYFRLVQRTKDGRLPTEEGIKFIYGDVPCLTTALSIDGDPVPYTHLARNEHRRNKAKILHVHEISEIAYKRTADYGREKASQIPMETLFNW
jgi:hypothetical protein